MPRSRRRACGMDDEHSSRRRARDRCIAGAVRESVQLEVGVEVQQRCFQRQSISRGRAIQCLPTFAGMTGSKRCRTHIARRGRSIGQQSGVATPRRCNLESRRPPARHGTSGLPRFRSPGRGRRDDCIRVSRWRRRAIAERRSVRGRRPRQSLWYAAQWCQQCASTASERGSPVPRLTVSAVSGFWIRCAGGVSPADGDFA